MSKVSSYSSAGSLADADLVYVAQDNGSGGYNDRTLSGALLIDQAQRALAPIRTYATSSTLSASLDRGAHVRVTATATITIPPDLPVGWSCVISNASASDTVDLAEGSGVTLLSVGTDVANGKWVALLVVASNTVEGVGAFSDDPDVAPSEISDLSDVDTSGVTTGDLLAYDGADWVPLGLGDVDGADLGSSAATDGFVLTADGAGGAAWEAVSGTGDVVGPASAVDDRIATFDGTTGKLLQDGGVTLAELVKVTDPISINAQTGTTYTLVLGDLGKLVTLDNGSAITLTVPTNASVAFPVGTVIALQQLGAGVISVEGATGVTINGTTPGSETLVDGQYTTTASLTKHATDTWTLTGAVA